MKSKETYIGIENRVRFEILESAIVDYIQNGSLDKVNCLNHIKQFTKGENRAIKILKHVSVLLTKNDKLMQKFAKAIGRDNYYTLSSSERKAFILCLFAISYPITYAMLTAFAQGFKVQDKLSKQAIIQKIGTIYGGNRAMDIAVTEIIPLFIECGIIKREEVGIYSIDKKLIVRKPFLAEMIIFADIFLSNSKSIMISDISHRPWFLYFDFEFSSLAYANGLVSKKDSSIGKNYLTIKTR